MSSATFDLHMREATFDQKVLTSADGTEFTVLRIETPAASVNLFTGSHPVSDEDAQTALALAETAGYFWRDTQRLADQAATTPASLGAVA